MKKVLLALVCTLILAMPAMAAEKSFTKMKLDVPAGWTAVEAEGGVVAVTAPGNEAALSIVYDKTGGASIADVAKAMSQQLGGTAPKQEDDLFTFTFKKNGVQSTSYVGGGDGEFIMFTLTDPSGKHGDTMGTIIQSVEPK